MTSIEVNKQFVLWVEGYQVTGDSQKARSLGTISGPSFHKAVENYVESIKNPQDREHWYFNEKLFTWMHWGCRTFDNEADARRAFG